MDDGRNEAALETLSQTTRQTREKFTHVIQALGRSDSATIGQSPKEALENAFDRFQLWVGSVGASVAAQRKISLDWRLRDAPEIKERIVELQSDLVEALDDLYAITTGQRDNRTRAADTVDLDLSSDSNAGSIQLRFKVDAVNEAQVILEVVLGCVKDLLRLSILIRKATPKDRWNKALQKPKDGRLDERFDIQHVGEKFPKLCRPEHYWLRHRLGRAITQRRQFIRYCREHKTRMQEPDFDDRIPTSSGIVQLGLMDHNNVPCYGQTTTALTVNHPVTEGSTHASTLQIKTLEAIRGDDDADSVATSVVSSLDPEDESKEMLRLPSLQTVSEGHDEFECPLCFTIQSFRQHRKWKKHAYSDLKPYVCCCGKGECDLELFSSRNTWFTHELENHRYHWICFLCQQEPLTSLARFQSHIRNKHVEIPVGQILEIAQVCKTPLKYISAIDCPFCDEFEAKAREKGGTMVGTEVVVVPAVIFRRHVSAHLEQVALFSLGPQNQPDEDMENGSVESRSDGSVRDAVVMEHFFNDQEEFEQDDPTPFFLEQGATRAVAETAAVTGEASLDTHKADKTRERKKAEKEEQTSHKRGNSSESISWLDTIDESGGSSYSSSVHSISPGGVRRKHLRNASGATEARPIEPEVGSEAKLDSTAELRASPSPKLSAIEVESSLDDSGRLIENKKRREAMEESGGETKGDDNVTRQSVAGFVAVEKGAIEEDSIVQSEDEPSRGIENVLAAVAPGLDALAERAESQSMEMVELQSKLALSSGKPVGLNFINLSREVVHRGYLWRAGFSSLHQSYIILLDNYFILTKPQYIVTHPPIPIELLVLEGFDEPSTFDIPGKGGKQRLFPIKITHLGKKTYTFLASSLDEWKTWCDMIVGAKTAYAASLHAQNTEPFRIRVLSDTAFAYDSTTHVQTPEIQAPLIKGTTLSRALEEAEHFSNQEPICRAKLNCATSYTVNQNETIVAGTETGVYVTYHDMSPSQWMKVITIPKVTQLAVLPAFSLFLVLSDKCLIAYPLGALHPHAKSDASRTAPQKLSSGRDVRFFNTCEMKERDLVIYGRQTGLSTTFKVLEPVIQKTPTKSRSRLFGRSNRDMFRDFDEFYIPAMCSGLNAFNASIAIHTGKGFEVLTLDKKQPWSVPDFKSPHVVEIARKLQNQTPLGMFRLDTNEFICCYDENAVYVNQHGDISRSVIMEYIGKANSATLKLEFLLLFHDNFVEIRDVQNGRLKQVIEGKDIRCLEDGGRDMSQTVKMVMRHPKNEELQLVLELVNKVGE